MDFLQSLLEQYNIPLLSAFVLGLMTAISPCPLATNITATAFVSKNIGSKRKVLLSGILYSLGRAFSYTLIGLVLYFGASKFHIQRFLSQNGEKYLGPLLIIIGLIMIGDSKKHEFNDNERRLLEMANHQVSAQILNALAHTDTQYQLVRGLEQLGLIEDITQQISQALELDIIIQNVLEAAIQSTHADFASISSPSPNNPKVFDMIWREVIDGELIPHHISFELDSGVVGHVMKTGATALVPRNDEFPDYIAPEGSTNLYQSSLAVPLKTRDEVIGVLNLESIYPNFFTPEQADFINSLAGHTAISITNANLFNERENQIRVLNSLRELSLDALQVIRPEDIYNAVSHTTSALLGSDETTLFHIENNDTQVLHSHSLHKDNTHLFTNNIPQQLLEEVASSNQPKFIKNIYKLTEQQSTAELSIAAATLTEGNFAYFNANNIDYFFLV